MDGLLNGRRLTLTTDYSEEFSKSAGREDKAYWSLTQYRHYSCIGIFCAWRSTIGMFTTNAIFMWVYRCDALFKFFGNTVSGPSSSRVC